MKTAYDNPNFARRIYKYKTCPLNMTLFKRVQMRLGLLPDWSVIERVTVKIKKIGTLKSNKQKEGDTEDETDERDEAGPPGKADMEAPKGTGNTIMNDTPDVVSRYENKLYLNKDMESSVSLIGLEIIWVFKGGGIGTWWIGTLL